MTSTDINSIIDNLAEKLGVATQEVYDALLRQAEVVVWKNTILILLCLAVIALTLVFIWKVFFQEKPRKSKYRGGELVDSTLFDRYDCDEEGMFLICAAIILIVVSVVCIIAISVLAMSIVNCLANPQWWAISKIFSMI